MYDLIIEEIEALKKNLEGLEKRKQKLKSENGEEYLSFSEVNGGEVYDRYGKVDNRDEINKISQEIKKVEKRLDELRKEAFTAKRQEIHEKEQSEFEVQDNPKENIIAEKEEKRYTKLAFNSLKRAYKSGTKNVFVRMFKRVTFNAPRWRQIKGLSREEMEFLMSINSGTTWERMYDSSKIVGEGYDNEKFYDKEERKEIRKSNWDAFCEKLNNRSVKAEIEYAMNREPKYEEAYEQYKMDSYHRGYH